MKTHIVTMLENISDEGKCIWAEMQMKLKYVMLRKRKIRIKRPCVVMVWSQETHIIYWTIQRSHYNLFAKLIFDQDLLAPDTLLGGLFIFGFIHSCKIALFQIKALLYPVSGTLASVRNWRANKYSCNLQDNILKRTAGSGGIICLG